MDPTQVTQITQSVIDLLLRLLLAAVVFIIGWIIAKVITFLFGKLLKWLRIDERLSRATSGSRPLQLQRPLEMVVYYLLLLVALVAALQVLGLTLITQPLNALLAAVFAWIPRLLAGIVVIVVAWVAATIIRGLIRRVLESFSFDKRLGDSSGVTSPSTEWPLSRTISEIAFWLTWLLFLPIIFAALGLEILVAPVMALIGDLLAWIPNLLVAVLIFIVGIFLARIVQRIVTNFFAAIGTDRLALRIGVTRYMGKQTLSGLLGLLTFVIVLIPILTASLEALNLQALTAPLTAMLTGILTAIPVILIAAAIVIVAIFIGRAVGDFVATFLEGLGFDNVLSRLGLSNQPINQSVSTTYTPSRIVGTVVTVGIVLLATLGAFTYLRLDSLALLLSAFLLFAGRVIIGLMVFAVGLWLANWLYRFILGSNWPRKHLLALIGRIAVIVLSLAISLSQMGFADSIIALAFGVPLVGVALAIGLAYGLGGREVAAGQLKNWQEQAKDVDAKLEARVVESTPPIVIPPPGETPGNTNPPPISS